MSFNSVSFAIFLPVIFFLYWRIAPEKQWSLLLFASYYFYMSWNAIYVLLILFTTVVSYFCGLMLGRTESMKKKKVILVSAGFICIGVLCLFKYLNFFIGIFCNIMNAFMIPLHPATVRLLLPVGISFYTFQTLSYVIDVYHGDIEPERHFGKYATFISFFPQLVAGPIERTENLLPQIKQKHYFKYGDTVYGLRQMLWGFFKKIVIADTLAYYVDKVYGNLFSYKGAALMIAVVFFSFQIYCDFSGYSDIAIGTAGLFGIKLMTNFQSPYMAESIGDFWRKWHVSLSTWFRDYVYIPLGGNRKGKVRKYINLLITFLLSGLWHGANITYVIWGGVHGSLQIIEDICKWNRKKKYRYLSMIIVFLFVTFAWIFFRADTLHESVYIIRYMFEGLNHPFEYVKNGLKILHISRGQYLKIGVMLIALLSFDFVNLKKDPFLEISKFPKLVRWGIYYALGVALIVYSIQNLGDNQFVYFQF